MRAAYQIQILVLQESFYNVVAEDKGNPPLVVVSSGDIQLRIGPQNIADEPLVGDFAGPVDLCELIEAVERGGEPPVHADYLIVDYRRYRHVLEDIIEGFPEF